MDAESGGAPVSVLSSDELIAERDPGRSVAEFAAAFASGPASGEQWMDNFRGVETVRRLAVHHGALLADAAIDPVVVALLCHEANSLRSAASRNALLGFEDVFRTPWVPNGNQDRGFLCDLEDTVALLLARSTNEKRFIADAAIGALKELAGSRASEPVLRALLAHCEHKNVRVVTQVAEAAARCVRCMGQVR